ncbi:response regulator [Aerosakkonema funiforme]|uniref:hybrid sensor histidine kinase/response regulator n=1 Tax=Aerosakkonema funiforme TaxID=1246630 RepID=UPI0035B7BBC2
MMNQIEIDDETYQFFVQESLELLQRLEEGLLTLQQDHSIKKVHNLMRSAHSIKGGAGCVGLTGIQTLAHELENGLRALYRENIKFDRELEELLLQAYDTLRSPLMEQIQTGKCSTDGAIEKIKLISSQLEVKLGHSLEEETQLPEVEMDVDIVQFLFTEEVEQGLARWSALLSNSQTSELVAKLKEQAEVFASIGELLNLPGFVAIAKKTISALQANPDRVKKIGKLAGADFRAAQAAVLKGDRSTGGSASAELVKLAQTTQLKAKTSNGHRMRSQPKAKSSTKSLLEDLEQNSGPIQNLQESTSSLLEYLDQTCTEVGISPKGSESESSLLADLENGLNRNSNGSPKPPSPIANLKPIVTKPSPKRESKNGFARNGSVKIEAVDIPVPPSPANLKLEATEEKQEPANDRHSKLAVRVDLERLELVNNLVGDLVTQENSFLLQHQQQKEIVDAIAQKLNLFHKQSRNYLNRVVTPPSPRSTRRGVEEKEELTINNYQLLVSLTQTIGEEIAQLQEAIQDMALTQQQVQQIIKKRQQTLKQLQTNILEARMLPLEKLVNRFPRMVRDLAGSHKQVNLRLIGMSTLIDKAILEKLYDPLIHLVRNALDHGIETPKMRQEKGKSATGTITIRAYHRGNHTYIEVQDDGQGIDVEKIARRVAALNLLSASEASKLPKKRLYEYMFVPGFSTAAQVSELSGRGVGLEAVRLQVVALKGSIAVNSDAGKGTTFILRLPFTLTITRLLIFTVNNNLLAIPVDALAAIALAPQNQIENRQGQDFYRWQGQLIPVYSESVISAYNYPNTAAVLWQRGADYLGQESGKVPLLLISQNSQFIALKIDRILMEQDLVIKPFGEVMTPPPYLYGCTIMGDGRMVPVIDSQQLVAWLQQQKSLANTPILDLPIAPNLNYVASSSTSTVLVIDDSLTMRKSLSLTLSKGGYQVLQARNGWEAIEQLRQNPQIKAIVSDVEMPQMNGFEFLSRCRKEFADRHLPIIMLTSRSSDRYRLLAKKLGATAYLTKPYLEKQLHNTLKACLQ